MPLSDKGALELGADLALSDRQIEEDTRDITLTNEDGDEPDPG